MNHLTTGILNSDKATDLRKAAELYRRAQAADVTRRPGVRTAAARLLRRIADRMDNERTRASSPLPSTSQIGSHS